MFWKVDKLARIDPPIQTLYLRSGGAATRTFTPPGARSVSSLVMRSAMPGYMVVPPERTMLLYLREKRLRISLIEGKAKERSQVAANIDVAGSDLENVLNREPRIRSSAYRVVGRLMDAGVFLAQERRLEECLGATEPSQSWSVKHSKYKPSGRTSHSQS